jgi:hypothetical protein
MKFSFSSFSVVLNLCLTDVTSKSWLRLRNNHSLTDRSQGTEGKHFGRFRPVKNLLDELVSKDSFIEVEHAAIFVVSLLGQF